MFEKVNPPTRHNPSGYTHAVIVPHGKRMMFVAGQLSGNVHGVLETDDLVSQFANCLDNVLKVVHAAGGNAQSIAKMVVFITDFSTYHAQKTAIAVLWHARFGNSFPAMSIIEVRELFDCKGKVEIEAVAFVD